MPLVAKVALSAATARSQVATSWQPAAVAMPCTLAITGWGRPTMVCIICAAAVEEGVVVRALGCCPHLLQVVAGAEGLASGAQDDDVDGHVGGERVERTLQRVEQVLGERVEAGRAVQRQFGDVAAVLAQQHGVLAHIGGGVRHKSLLGCATAKPVLGLAKGQSRGLLERDSFFALPLRYLSAKTFPFGRRLGKHRPQSRGLQTADGVLGGQP